MILLDSNVLSEVMRPSGQARVKAWLSDRRHRETTFVSTISLGELARGVAELAPGAKRSTLTDWLRETKTEFADRFIDVDSQIAELCGMRQGEMRRKGVTISLADGLIAATARVRDLRVATRNTRHLLDAGAPTYDPWTGELHEPAP